MTRDLRDINIREYIRLKKPELATRLDYLWLVSKELHDLQNRGDGTENGRDHVEMVEHNVWRFLVATTDKKNQPNIKNFNVTEIFLLSCAACCHDFDKALEKYDQDVFPKQQFAHGEGSADFVRKNHMVLGLEGIQARDIGEIIRIHHLLTPNFETELKKLQKELAIKTGTINHHRLAVLLKASDILHTDQSRIRTVGVDASKFTGLKREKYLARSCIRGWLADGHRVIIQATPENSEQEQALSECIEYMTTKEWPTVAEYLDNYDFPSKLELKKLERSISEANKHAAKERTHMGAHNQAGPDRNIDLKGDRLLDIPTTDSMLCCAFERTLQFPMCIYEATSHGAGSAVAGLAVLMMLDKMKYLKDEFNATARDLRRESIFSPNKLKEHIVILTKIKSFLAYISNDQTASLGQETYNILNTTFCNLPGGKEILRKDIGKIKTDFDSQFRDLCQLMRRIALDIQRLPSEEARLALEDKAKWKDDIEPTLRTNSEKLLSLHDELDNIIEKLNRIKDSINDGWILDIVQLWEQDACRPRKERKLATRHR